MDRIVLGKASNQFHQEFRYRFVVLTGSDVIELACAIGAWENPYGIRNRSKNKFIFRHLCRLKQMLAKSLPITSFEKLFNENRTSRGRSGDDNPVWKNG